MTQRHTISMIPKKRGFAGLSETWKPSIFGLAGTGRVFKGDTELTVRKFK